MTDRFVRRDGIAHQKLDGLTLVVVPKERLSHRLNETATHVWDRLAEPRSIDELAADLEREFEVDADRAREDVRAHLDAMVALGLVDRR